MKKRQQTKYWHNFKSRHSQYSQVPNKREGKKGLVNCNFGTFIAHLNLWILSSSHPLSNLWFSMKRPSPNLEPNLPFYGSNNRKLAWNTISSLFWASVPICNPYELDKTKRMVFWSFQGVKNWSIASKWVTWMDQGLAISVYYDTPSICDFKLKYPPALLDSYLLLPLTIKN